VKRADSVSLMFAPDIPHQGIAADIIAYKLENRHD